MDIVLQLGLSRSRERSLLCLFINVIFKKKQLKLDSTRNQNRMPISININDNLKQIFANRRQQCEIHLK